MWPWSSKRHPARIVVLRLELRAMEEALSWRYEQVKLLYRMIDRLNEEKQHLLAKIDQAREKHYR